ncbi:transposase [Actinokineospora sp. HUAS TT18]|uniref:transposase n=1 Tax=Actinokineospora sp. HUAS TT18 TaxID=3447451 RepID=UPI003F51ADE7
MCRNSTGAEAGADWTTVPSPTAILYVLQTGCAWSALPASFGVSSPTAHRRFTE